jgi:hypothetical protein
MAEDKIAALIEEFCEKGMLDSIEVPGGLTRYAPRDWASRQYVDGTAADRAKRYRDKQRGVTRDGRDGNGAITALEQKQKKRTEQTGVTDLIEVTDDDALAAWDAYGRATNGKPYPRNRRGGWHFPAKWPPGHEAEIRPIGRAAS